MVKDRYLKIIESQLESNPVLSAIISSGTLNENDVAELMRKEITKDILSKEHPYEIYQCKDGRWRTYIPDPMQKNGRRPVAKKNLSDLEDYLIEYYRDEAALTLTDIYPIWYREKEANGAAPDTLDKFSWYWRNYYQDKKISKICVQDLKRSTIKKWADDIINNEHPTRKRYNNIAVIIRGCLDWAVNDDLVPINLARGMRIENKNFKPEEEKPLEKLVFTHTELSEMIKLAWHDGIYGYKRKHQLLPWAMLFQFQTGLRVGELASLRHEDIDWVNNRIHVRRNYRFKTKEFVPHTKGKDGKRTVPLTPDAKLILQIAKKRQEVLGAPTDNLIFSEYEEPASYDAFRSLYKSYCKKIGICEKGTHSGRRQFVSILLEAGVPPEIIRRACGHRDVQTTLKYYTKDICTAEETLEYFEKAFSNVS